MGRINQAEFTAAVWDAGMASKAALDEAANHYTVTPRIREIVFEAALREALK